MQVDGQVVAAVERKSLQHLVGTLTSGKMRYLLADLAALVHAGEGGGHVDHEASALPSAAAPSPAEVRVWARLHGHEVSARGRIPREILDAFARRHD